MQKVKKAVKKRKKVKQIKQQKKFALEGLKGSKASKSLFLCITNRQRTAKILQQGKKRKEIAISKLLEGLTAGSKDYIGITTKKNLLKTFPSLLKNASFVIRDNNKGSIKYSKITFNK